MTTLVDAISVWQPLVVGRISDADEALINQELTAAIREFCTLSLAWQEEIGPYNVEPDTILKLDEDCSGGTCTGTYPETLQAEVAYVMEISVDGEAAFPVTSDFDKLDSTPGISVSGSRYYYYCPSPRWVKFMPSPEATLPDACLLRVAMQPTCAEMKVPVYFQTHYFDEVLDGALGRIYSYSKKPWSDSSAASYHLSRFRNGIARARDISHRRFTRSDSEWAFPRTGWV